jgi:glycosyltransferase involved in cell wall biosynthesis
LKALILLGTAKIGGAELQGLALGKLLKEKGLAVEIGCLSNNGECDSSLFQLASKNNLNIRIIEFSAKNQFLYVLNLFKIAKLISERYDICFGFTKVPSIIAALCSRRVVKIWLQRDVMKNRVLYLFDYAIALKSNFILANSKTAAKYTRQRTLFLKKVKCLGNLQDIRFKENHSNESKINFQCISVSNFKESKNVDQIIKIWVKFTEIPEVKVQQVKLILIGNIHESYYDVKYLQHLKNKYNIIILNNCSEPFDYYISSLFYLTATRTESRSNSIDHAMYFGLPIVGFNHSSICEQVDKSNLELLIDPEDHDEYTNILLNCYKNPKKYLNIGKKNRIRINEYFSNSQAEWFEFLDTVI